MISDNNFAQAYADGFLSTLRLLIAKGIRREEAEEFAQSAWSRGWEAREQLKEPAKIVAWVNSIALRLMFGAKRKAKRFRELDDAYQGQQAPAPVLFRLDAVRLLNKCSKLDRSLLVDRYAGGMNMEEIAERHGLSCTATRVRIHRSRLALRSIATPKTMPAAAAA